jgi:hypothetical protein
LSNLNIKFNFLGGNVFSKKALINFHKLAGNSSFCFQNDDTNEDVLTGNCLSKHAFFVDDRDEKDQKRFFPLKVSAHLIENDAGDLYWYSRYMWGNQTKKGLDCCSDLLIEIHYVSPVEMIILDAYIYYVHPFGISKNVSEKLPRKLSLAEIVASSDSISSSPNFKPHEGTHADEIFN